MKYFFLTIILLVIIGALLKDCYICAGLGIGVYVILYLIETNDKAREIIDKIF